LQLIDIQLQRKKKGIAAYNIAVDDFLNAPNIESVDSSTYMDTTRDKFHIVATNAFAVKSAHVQISYANDFLIEKTKQLQLKIFGFIPLPQTIKIDGQ
jgi:hypothetical protein